VAIDVGLPRARQRPPRVAWLPRSRSAIALENARLLEDLRASREELRASRARIVEAADGERRRIARDLHDGMQARLVLLAIQANGVRIDADAPPAVRAQALHVESGLQAAISELRALVQGVMPDALTEHGLFSAVEDLVDRVPLPTELHLGPGRAPLPHAVESSAYFVISEAIANAIKHADASALAVQLEHRRGWLELEVRDDGIGGARACGAGIRGMADRVEAFGGRLTVASAPGRGTRVSARFPCVA
jgi:signal transduction histidine kinase